MFQIMNFPEWRINYLGTSHIVRKTITSSSKAFHKQHIHGAYKAESMYTNMQLILLDIQMNQKKIYTDVNHEHHLAWKLVFPKTTKYYTLKSKTYTMQTISAMLNEYVYE